MLTTVCREKCHEGRPKRIFRVFRKLLAAGGIAALTLVGTGQAAMVLSNGNFDSPNTNGGYASYFQGVTNWNPHNMLPAGGYNNGDLNLMSMRLLPTGGMATGGLYGQYALAMRQGDPFPVFSGGVGNVLSAGNGMYIDQQIGTLDAGDLTKSFSLSADLIRAMGPSTWWYNVSPPTWAGAGITIGFVNGNTGAILAQETISYTQSYPGSDQTTPFKTTNAVTWNAAGSGLPIGTPINVFVGFRVNPGLNTAITYNTNAAVDFNTVAVDNLVLTSSAASSYPSLTWTGSDSAHPTQWSTASTVHNWLNGGTAAAYTEGGW